MLDRLLRGRGWVVLVGALLAGIVFLNVSVLELNRGIAKTSTSAAALERSNSTLRARVADLDSAERIQKAAEARGFILPQPGDVTYVRAHSRDAELAAERIEPPASGGTDVAAPATPTDPYTATAPTTQTTAVPSATTTTMPTTPAAPAATSTEPSTATAPATTSTTASVTPTTTPTQATP